MLFDYDFQCSSSRRRPSACCDLMLFDYDFQWLLFFAPRVAGCDLMLFDYDFQSRNGTDEAPAVVI